MAQLERNSTLDDVLSIDLSHVLPPEARQEIIAVLWNLSFSPEQFAYNEPRFSAYLKHYQRECQQSTVGSRERNSAFSSHRQVLDSIVFLSSHRDTTGIELRGLLAEKIERFRLASARDQNMGIALCLRVWLMANVRDATDPTFIIGTGSDPLNWSDESTVLQLLTRIARIPTAPVQVSMGMLDHEFHARSLERLAGMRICFTANLVDHLRYDPKTRRLLIFHYNAYLVAHMGHSDTESSCWNVYDQDFIRETQQTLGLLFPCWDHKATAYLHRLQNENSDLDPTLGTIAPASTDIQDYRFYRDRLYELNEVLTRTEPETVKQMWFNRRNKVQWWTLWTAVVVVFLTLVFGFISSATGIVQVMLAVKAAKEGN